MRYLKSYYRFISRHCQLSQLRGVYVPSLRSSLLWKLSSKHEITKVVMAASSFNAPGLHGLPLIVWQRLWSELQEEIFAFFESSIQSAQLPAHWKKFKNCFCGKGRQRRLFGNQVISTYLAVVEWILSTAWLQHVWFGTKQKGFTVPELLEDLELHLINPHCQRFLLGCRDQNVQ